MWQNKNVWILLTGEFVAGLGLWLGIIGNLEFMQEKVPSDFMKAVILAIGLLAGVAIGPYAGRVTDQMKKKTVMIVAGLARAISVIFMLVAIQTGSVLWMVIFLILIQAAAAFYFPALQAAIPLVVKEKELLQMNGIHMNVATLSRVLGTAIAGIFLVIMSLSTMYLLSLGAYFLLVVFTFFLTIEENDVSDTKRSKAESSFTLLFPIIKELPIVMMTLIMTLVPLLFIGGFNLLVISISELQDNSLIKSWIYTAEGLSFMVGAFAVKRISSKQSPYTILFLFSFIIGLSQLLLFFANSPVLSVIAFSIFGYSVGCFFPTAATIFQTRVPKEFHGRFFSFRNMLDRIIFQIVLLLTGLMLDLIGLQMMSVIFGIMSITITSIFFLKYRQSNSTSLNMDVRS
ncbi:MFS transporter [Pseudalkalibacillus hwajinpoensis]|uniref:MFS transporter n=1 Tax=Guptibacillus hwajinpoensis TaxID=208199 RepID=UPI001CD35CD0|nr:MFS transporter [Pseudalkalibacillus hwajinpoensis]MCA0991693.1 MFS transporter [Pseudalkalibacillus hwajinpoensis]